MWGNIQSDLDKIVGEGGHCLAAAILVNTHKKAHFDLLYAQPQTR